MRNPLTSLKIPEYKDYPKIFSNIYKISTNASPDTDKEFLGLGQEYRATCYYGCERSVLLNDFGIAFSHEYDLIKLHTDIDKKKSRLLGRKYDEEKNDIKREGFRIKDVRNIANFFGLNAFNSNKANMDELIQLVDFGINPIVFRTVRKNDKEGHFVVVYAHDKDKIYFFDPSYRGDRPKENTPHKGWYRKDSPEKFMHKWTNEDLDGGYVFFYGKRDRPKIKLDGYYLT